MLAAQVIVLVMLLAGLLAFRDRIGAGAGAFFDTVSAPDVQIGQPASAPPSPSTDAPVDPDEP